MRSLLFMSDSKLILYPIDPIWCFEPTELANMLASIGLLGQAFLQKKEARNSHFYYAGENFLQLIEFVSSHFVRHLEIVDGELVETQISDSKNSCYISLELYQEPSFLGSALTQTPFCTNCRYVIEDWTNLVSDWYSGKENYVWHCPQCQTVSAIYALDWNKRNGFAKCSIDIWDIWLDEARPSKKLLIDLKRITDKEWTFLYYRI